MVKALAEVSQTKKQVSNPRITTECESQLLLAGHSFWVPIIAMSPISYGSFALGALFFYVRKWCIASGFVPYGARNHSLTSQDPGPH
jgi:hypothetical protein